MSTPNIKTCQLLITEVLKDGLSGVSAVSSDSKIGDPIEPIGQMKSGTKRQRKKQQLTGETPNPPNKRKNKLQKTPPTMANNQDKKDSTGDNEVELTPELLLLEQRLESKFQTSINKVLEPIQEKLNKLANTGDEVAQNKLQLTSLKNENDALKKAVSDLKENCDELKSRLNKLENRSLECNLIISGIPENRWKTDDSRVCTLYRYIADTFEMEMEQDRYNRACSITIECCKRLGPCDANRIRPIRVEFASKYEADRLYENMFHLEKGIFVDREYNKERE